MSILCCFQHSVWLKIIFLRMSTVYKTQWSKSRSEYHNRHHFFRRMIFFSLSKINLSAAWYFSLLRLVPNYKKCAFMSEITFLEQFMFEAKHTCLKPLMSVYDDQPRVIISYSSIRHASHSSPWAVVLRNISGLEWLTAVKIRYKLIFYCRVSLSRLSRTRGYITGTRVCVAL